MPFGDGRGLRLPAGEHRVGKASTWTDRVGRDRTPSIPGQELAGVVTAFGYGTTGLSVGQRESGLTDSYRGGGLAEYAAIEARNLAPLPGDVDFTVGASLPMPGVEPLRLSPCSGQ